MFKILDKFGGEVSANEQAIFNRISTNNSSGYVNGYLNSLGISKLTSNVIGIDSGLLSIQGFRFVNDTLQTYTVSVTPSEPIPFQLVAVFSHYVSSENDTLEIITRPTESLRQENLYSGSNAVYELELARFTMTTDGITDFVVTLEQLTYNDQDFTAVLEQVATAETNSAAALEAATTAEKTAAAARSMANEASDTASTAASVAEQASADVAELSEQIGEKQGTTVTIGGVAQGRVALESATVGNAEKLNGKAANEYALNNGLRNTAPTIKTQNTWYRKTWNGITTFDGRNIWTDGENIYYSYDAEQYVLNRATSTWDKKTWNGIDGDNRMRGVDIWSDGKTIYYSYASLQYVLDKTSSTWNPKTWRDITDIGLEIYGSDIWTDGENIYFSHYRSGQYRLLPSGQWEEISWTWNGTDRSGIITTGLWIDGNHIYYSNAGENYELNKSTMTWELKSWNRDTSITEKEFSCLCGACIWSDGETIYCSSDSRYVDGLVRAQFYLDKNTSTWMPKEWLGLDSSLIFYSGNSLWSDGNNIYYSEDTEQYVLAELIKSTRPILNH